MSRAKKAKVLIDSDKKRYTFDRIAFNDAIRSMQKSDGNSQLTKGTIHEQIAQACSVSVDAVKKWASGANGIGNIDTAIRISNVLNVDYHTFLTPVHEIQEGKIMTNNTIEENVIKSVFGTCVSVIYKIDEIERLPAKKRREDKISNQSEVDEMIRSAHMYVDQQMLVTGMENHYRLHRILHELNTYAANKFNSVPGWSMVDRWDDISSIMSAPEVDYVGDANRDSGLKCEDYEFKRIYLIDEIALADNLGLSECIEPTEAEWDTLAGDCTRFGYSPERGVELNPSIVAIDLIVNVLQDVFLADFPEAYGR